MSQQISGRSAGPAQNPILLGSSLLASAAQLPHKTALRRGTKCWSRLGLLHRRSFQQTIPVGLIAAADIFITVVLAPNLSLLLLTTTGIYKPLWFIFGSAEVSILGPDIRHGLLLATCWLVSAAFARLFAREVTDRRVAAESAAIWWRLFLAFFVNAWLLLFAASFMGLFQPFSQADVLRMGIDKDMFGPSGLNVDVKVFRQIIDLNIDIAIEVVLLGSWRLFCAGVNPVVWWKAWSRQIWGE